MAVKDPLIDAGEQIVSLLSKGKYSPSALRVQIENLEKGASERSATRVETHRPDEWQIVIHALWPIKSALEKQGTVSDETLAATLADSLEAAEARGE